MVLYIVRDFQSAKLSKETPLEENKNGPTEKNPGLNDIQVHDEENYNELGADTEDKDAIQTNAASNNCGNELHSKEDMTGSSSEDDSEDEDEVLSDTFDTSMGTTHGEREMSFQQAAATSVDSDT